MSSVLPSVAEKPRFVAEMFDRIAPRYDLMNTLMTFGQDTRWRQTLADSLSASGLPSTPSILDVGTGTGRLADAVRRGVPGAQVVGVDFTLQMLRRASIEVVAADALQLPFASARFDAVISGFLVRNLADVRRGVAEQLRVLRPGGLLVILETTPGPEGILRPLYQAYFRQAMPLLGGLIAGDAAAYTYLPESTLAFLDPARLAEVLLDVGLVAVHTRRLAIGTVALTIARKPA